MSEAPQSKGKTRNSQRKRHRKKREEKSDLRGSNGPNAGDFSYVYLVRYGSYHFREAFGSGEGALAIGDSVVVKSPRDVEMGVVVSAARQPEEHQSVNGPILRRASEKDRTRADHFNETARKQYWEFVEQKTHELGLRMSLVNIERLFGGQKVVVHYTAAGRVDFRELVRVLARNFRARIEMRQIGPRDCTRIHGGLGTCGREVCCSSFLNYIEPVTIRMAKEQGQPLTPSKNCGLCGKLKCCLRYEMEPEALQELKNNKRKPKRQ